MSTPSRTESRERVQVPWAAIGVVIALLALIHQVSSSCTEPEGIGLLLFHPDKSPCSDTKLVCSNGDILRPDAEGLVFVNADRAGAEVSIRDLQTRIELRTIVLPASGTHRFEVDHE